MPEFATVTPLHAGFAHLADEARAEGYRFVDRLHGDWISGNNRFNAGGERLLGLVAQDGLLAIGGLNIDPYAAASGTGRLRHLYVRPRWRARVSASILYWRCLRPPRSTSFAFAYAPTIRPPPASTRGAASRKLRYRMQHTCWRSSLCPRSALTPSHRPRRS